MIKILKRILVSFLLLIVLGFVFFQVFLGKDRSEIISPFLGRPVEEQAPLNFAVISDIHLDYISLEKALEKIKQTEAEFIIVTGDLASLGRKSELISVKEILDKSGMNYYVIPGNHDLWWGRKNDQDTYNQIFGDSFQSFEKDKTKFILINNGDWQKGVSGVEEKGINQQTWLEQELVDCLDFYCLVFAHMPLNHTFSDYIMGADSEAVATEAAKLVKTLVNNNVKEMFVGHLHYSTSYQLEGLRTTIIGAITSDNYQTPRFLLVTKKGDELKKEVILLED